MWLTCTTKTKRKLLKINETSKNLKQTMHPATNRAHSFIDKVWLSLKKNNTNEKKKDLKLTWAFSLPVCMRFWRVGVTSDKSLPPQNLEKKKVVCLRKLLAERVINQSKWVFWKTTFGQRQETKQQQESRQSRSVQNRRGERERTECRNDASSAVRHGHISGSQPHLPPPHVSSKEANTDFKLQLRNIYSLRNVLKVSLEYLRKKFCKKKKKKEKKMIIIKIIQQLLSHIILAPSYQQWVTYTSHRKLAFICTMHSDSKRFIHRVNKKRGNETMNTWEQSSRNTRELQMINTKCRFALIVHKS